MRLYTGPGHTGSATQTSVTDADGLLSFADLGAGAYSVQEVLRPGYLNVSPLCQDVTLAQSPNGGSLFQFDLSGIPAGSTVISAAFQAYLMASSTTPPLLDVELKQVDDPWTEFNVT